MYITQKQLALSSKIVTFVLLLGRKTMLKTVMIGSCVSVQGIFVKALEDGLVCVRVGEQLFKGRPVSTL